MDVLKYESRTLNKFIDEKAKKRPINTSKTGSRSDNKMENRVYNIEQAVIILEEKIDEKFNESLKEITKNEDRARHSLSIIFTITISLFGAFVLTFVVIAFDYNQNTKESYENMILKNKLYEENLENVSKLELEKFKECIFEKGLYRCI